jgi:hypothetical protein
VSVSDTIRQVAKINLHVNHIKICTYCGHKYKQKALESKDHGANHLQMFVAVVAIIRTLQFLIAQSSLSP